MAIALAALLAAGAAVRAQTPNQQNQNQQNAQKPGSNQQPSNQQQPAPPQPAGNPFPEDENAVPVMPSSNSPANSPDLYGGASGGFPAPATDSDPVRSPGDPQPAASSQGFSSSTSGLGDLNPPDNDVPTRKGKKQDDSILEPPPETPKEDIDVGAYYMDTKDWKGALSRFQSAMVLAPDNPDVYWGLAVCEQHTGDFTDARANYLKVMEYDPGSHHAKEAKKALRDPEIANAKPAGK